MRKLSPHEFSIDQSLGLQLGACRWNIVKVMAAFGFLDLGASSAQDACKVFVVWCEATAKSAFWQGSGYSIQS